MSHKNGFVTAVQSMRNTIFTKLGTMLLNYENKKENSIKHHKYVHTARTLCRSSQPMNFAFVIQWITQNNAIKQFSFNWNRPTLFCAMKVRANRVICIRNATVTITTVITFAIVYFSFRSVVLFNSFFWFCFYFGRDIFRWFICACILQIIK